MLLLLLQKKRLSLFFHYKQLHKEDKVLLRAFGQEYQDFKDRVPRLFPTPKSIVQFLSTEDREGSFNWRNPNITRRYDIPRFLVAVSYPLLFAGWFVVRGEGVNVLTHAPSLGVCAFYGWLGFLFCAYLTKRRIKKIRSA